MTGIRFILTAALCLLSVVTACKPVNDRFVSETDEKQYQLAKNLQSQGLTAEALNAFEKVIQLRRNAPESHFEAGYIYLKAMGDPIKAIYHFDEYLRLKPDSPQARQVRQLKETAQKEFARQLPAQPYEGELSRMDMMEMVSSLRQENDRLKRDFVAAQQRIKALESKLSNAAERIQMQQSSTYNRSQTATVSPNPTNVPRTYVVQPGDSLSSISRTMYGTPSRWSDIYQANRDRLSSENALRVGQELRIP